jgi:TonB family protein
VRTQNILSDTQGVDFGPYLTRVLHDAKLNWYNMIPEVARPPIMKKGKVSIEFAITKQGQVAGMKLVGPSGDVSLDRAAWAGINAANPFPPLPAKFNGQYLALRFHFYYNPEQTDHLAAGPFMVLPAHSRVSTGDTLPFSTDLGKSKPVLWTISGDGCTGTACGTISPAGLYTAPATVPNPPTIKVTATQISDPSTLVSVEVKPESKK